MNTQTHPTRISLTEGDHTVTGGVIDPERGALMFKKKTEIEHVTPYEGSHIKKKIKRVTSETSWIGKPDKESLLPPEDEENDYWQDDELEKNPLYSTADYSTDFSNPLYSRRMYGAGREETIELQPRLSGGKDGRALRGKPSSPDTGGREYVDYLSEQPDLGNLDTLF